MDQIKDRHQGDQLVGNVPEGGLRFVVAGEHRARVRQHAVVAGLLLAASPLARAGRRLLTLATGRRQRFTQAIGRLLEA